MASDKKITELTELTPVDNNDWVPVVDASESDPDLATKKAKRSEFKGDTGTAGAAATIAAGTTTTGAPGSSASVTNSGSTSAAVFEFTIPRGDVGATGAIGATGSASAASSIDLTEIATPSAPSASHLLLYAKSDDKVYKQTSAGVETEIGSGGGGDFLVMQVFS